MTFHIITLFPRAFDSYLGESILKRAIENKKIKIKFYNPRDYTKDKWRRVDQKPYGGGPGMVLEALSLLRAAGKIYSQVLKNLRINKRSPFSKKLNAKIILLSPSGKQFDATYARRISKRYDHIILLCGRYEGIDARVKKILKAEEISVGPYVLTGGELPAMMVIDCVARQIPGVLGNFNSREEARVASSEVYTRPAVLAWKGKFYRVPKVLLSGHHGEIQKWRARGRD